MTVADIDSIMPIEQASFVTPWPANAYFCELTRNHFSRYYVIRVSRPGSPFHRRKWWNRALGFFSRSDSPVLVGYGGFWMLGDEAHISTIAIHPDYRRHGLGGLLMVHLLEEAILLGAEEATLEVRVSNVAAQRLYEKLGFVKVGLRKKYYSDNQEDALIMTVEGVQVEQYRRRMARWKKEWAAKAAMPVTVRSSAVR
jgi:ribosomal-protein-alanine N-acetyltransferase